MIDHQVQFNLLTDRMMLKEMNNCNAGYESITLAPDGNLYICLSFSILMAKKASGILKMARHQESSVIQS